MGKTSRNKGKVGEREVANILREHGYDARRGVQYHGGGDSPDVVGLPGIHIEVKRTERFELWKALDQAKNDHRPGTLPAVFHRPSRRPWVVVMELEDWLRIYKAARELRDCRNELCQKCGDYKNRHLGACSDCRWLAEQGLEW